MSTVEVGLTKNHQRVYADIVNSHLASHLADTPGLLEVMRECVGDITVDGNDVYLDKNMGRIVGVSKLVETSAADTVFYAKRMNHSNYTRFVRNRRPQPTSYVSMVLRRDEAGNYELWSAWLGPKAPQFPGDEFETPDSKPFWREHALVWGDQPIKAGTETENWPWGD